MGNTEARPHWKQADVCDGCKVELGFFTRHHCRNCGGTFCDACSGYAYYVVQYYDDNEKKRVCKDCFEYLSRFGTEQVMQPRTKKNLGLQDFDLLTIIGTGKYGKVVKVRRKATGKVYAMKILNKKNIVDGGEVQHTIAERNILMKIKHPFLMKLHYAFQTTEKLALVMDFVNGGELFYHLQLQPNRRFSNERACFYAAEICLGIEHLHVMGIIYRDLKPENILIDSEGHIRLTDFGLSKEGLFNDRTNTFCGTPEYLAPEVLEGGDYNNAVDWWGFGALIYEMLTGWAPFYEKDVQKMYQLKISRKIGVPSYVDQHAKHLLIRLLDRNPDTRMTDPKKIKTHAWFNDIDWEKLYNKEIAPPYIPDLNSVESVGMIDSVFTNKDVNAEIGSADEPAIDDTNDPRFNAYSYFPERDLSEITETGSWPPRGKSIGFECLAEKEGIEIYEPSKSQPGSYSSYDPAVSILESLGKDVEPIDSFHLMNVSEEDGEKGKDVDEMEPALPGKMSDHMGSGVPVQVPVSVPVPMVRPGGQGMGRGGQRLKGNQTLMDFLHY